ncbi:hypothetical protein J6W32_04510 [bacterium]|nr:hypothetical protein [bacterium]MBP5783823.1 hypothetical protein [bacterium]
MLSYCFHIVAVVATHETAAAVAAIALAVVTPKKNVPAQYAAASAKLTPDATVEAMARSFSCVDSLVVASFASLINASWVAAGSMSTL